MGHGIFLNSHKFNINTTIPVPPVIIDIPPVGTPLKDWTWKQISYVSQKGDAQKYFNIGDETTAIIIDNAGRQDTYTVRIIGFDHDNIEHNEASLYGRATAGITFETVGVLNNKYQLINYDSSTISIEVFFLPDLHYSFICGGTQVFDPKTETKIYTPCITKYLNTYEREGVEVNYPFFILSAEEYNDSYPPYNNSSSYEYYLNQNNLIKKNNSGDNCSYFTRSYNRRSYFSGKGSSDGINWDTDLSYSVDHLIYINRYGRISEDEHIDTIHTTDYISLAFCV